MPILEGIVNQAPYYLRLRRQQFLAGMLSAILLLNFDGIIEAKEPAILANSLGLAKSVLKIGQSDCIVLLQVFSKSHTTDEHIAEAKLICAGKVLSLVQFDPIDTPALQRGSYQYTISGKILADRGLSGHAKLICFHFEYQACDYECGDVILILNRNKLSYGLTASTSSNEQCQSNFQYVFPNDKNGRANQLRVIYTFKDPETKRQSSQDQIENYSWNGEKFKHTSGSRPTL